jgi:hypothetical protein
MRLHNSILLYQLCFSALYLVFCFLWFVDCSVIYQFYEKKTNKRCIAVFATAYPPPLPPQLIKVINSILFELNLMQH